MYATLLLLLLLPLPGQEDPEEAYRQQYGQYQDIAELTDPAEQAERYLAFLDEGVDERLLGAVLQGLQQDLQLLTEQGEYDSVYTLAEEWMSRRSEQQPLALAFQAAMASGDGQQIVNYGEKFYAVQQVPEVALILAETYNDMGNDPKVREFGTVAIENLPLDETWSIAYDIVGQHESADRWAEAAAMARKLRSGLTAAPEGVGSEEWQQIQIYLQDTIARDAYEADRHDEAIEGYRALLDLNPRSDKAYYFIGRSHLASDRTPDAMDSFAKATILEGSYQSAARENLEAIIRANTGGNLELLDEILSDARQDLGNP